MHVNSTENGPLAPGTLATPCSANSDAQRAYDAIVIGSSPLMLLIALQKAKEGQRTCVVDRSEAVGGFWRTVPITPNWEVEYACHVVEEFPGVYEYLESASGVAWRPLIEQPIRVTRSGKILPYSSRSTVLLATVWSIGKLILHRLKVAIGRAHPQERERAAVFRQKIVDFARYHKGMIIRGSTIKGPVGGYAAFMRTLVARCDERGVDFHRFDVSTAQRVDQEWVLRNDRGEKLTTPKIHATTSATLEQTGAREFSARKIGQVMTRAILVKVPRKDIQSQVSYAAFWEDPQVVRVSRVDEPQERPEHTLYLIQLRPSVKESASQDLIKGALEKCGALGNTGGFSIVREIECPRIPIDRQLAAGNLAPGFQTHSSLGNLASGVARWLSDN